ncbi:MAG: phospholipase D family protein [Sphingobacteriia bacterium]|nr:phospholipase D family protein [Sphingobacteriia bacterium]
MARRKKIKTTYLFNATNNKFFALLLALLVGFIFYLREFTHHFTVISPELDVEVCFTPPSGCREVIINKINLAKTSIYMQAYSFTSKPIYEALENAARRGINVRILLDKSQLTEPNTVYKPSLPSTSLIHIDIDRSVKGIAHNKVIIIDDLYTITGSYNFSNGAEFRNAENVVIIKNKDIAKEYKNNWQFHYYENKLLSFSSFFHN